MPGNVLFPTVIMAVGLLLIPPKDAGSESQSQLSARVANQREFIGRFRVKLAEEIDPRIVEDSLAKER